MQRAINVSVNGVSRQHEVEPRLLLVHYMRDVLGLTGTHIGCETSLCGACTVSIDVAILHCAGGRSTDRNRRTATEAWIFSHRPEVFLRETPANISDQHAALKFNGPTRVVLAQ